MVFFFSNPYNVFSLVSLGWLLVVWMEGMRADRPISFLLYFFFFSSEAFYLYVLHPKNLRIFPPVCFRLGDLTPSVSDFFSLGGFEDFHVKHTIRGYCYCWSGDHTYRNTQLDNDLIMPTSHLIQDEIKISQTVAVRNKQPSKLALCLIPKQCL